MPPPPPVHPPPPPRPPRAGRGWRLAVLILGGLLALSLFLNFAQFLGSLITITPSAPTAGPELHEVVLEDHKATDKIAVVPVHGLIYGDLISRSGYSLIDYIKYQLRRAGKDRRVKAVILDIDSPGGEVLAADRIAKLLTDFQKKTRKPIVAVMGSVGASGGYYVAAPCRWIVAHELTITGSIGVILHSFNYRGLLDKVGVKPVVYKSGRFKDMLSGDRPESAITQEERAMLQRLIDQSFQRFKQVIADGRRAAHQAHRDTGQVLREDWEQFADGRVLSGKEAYDIGLVDELGDFQTAYRRALKLAGISKANVVEYREVVSLANLFRLLGQAPSATLKVEAGVKLPPIKTGRLYYLAPSFLE